MRKINANDYVKMYNNAKLFRDEFLLWDECEIRIVENDVFDVQFVIDDKIEFVYSYEYVENTCDIFDQLMQFNFEMNHFEYDENNDIVYVYECDNETYVNTHKLTFTYVNRELTFVNAIRLLTLRKTNV